MTTLQVINEVAKRCDASLIVSDHLVSQKKVNDKGEVEDFGDKTHTWRAAIIDNEFISKVLSSPPGNRFIKEGGGVICGMTSPIKVSFAPYTGTMPKSLVFAGSGMTRDEALNEISKLLVQDRGIDIILSSGKMIKIPPSESLSELKLKLEITEPL